MDSLFLLRSIHFSAEKHRHQRRKDHRASPYINHPIETALVLAEVGGIEDREVLAAAILHDTLEDTDTTAEELKLQFGQRVLSIVEAVTDDKSLPKEERKEHQILNAPALSAEATLVKIADKICNVRDVVLYPPHNWTLHRRLKYLDWAEKVVNRCSLVNPALDTLFRQVLDDGRRRLQEAREESDQAGEGTRPTLLKRE